MIRIATMLFIFGATPLRAQDVPQFLKALPPRGIGPANMSGRICDVAVYEADPRIFYVASATGGLWKTTNFAATLQPVFEHESSISLGAVAVFQKDPDIVWVGAGEANARNSVSWGDGAYRSTDGGKSWKHLGLKETKHIGRIVLHPEDPKIAYVAALGKLWGPSPERGVFVTTDAGKTWEKVLYFDENTGAVDLAMDPGDPKILYACLYPVRRGPFSGGNPAAQTGPNGGVYRSADAGRTWEKLGGGLPDRPCGRCGVSVCRKNPNIVYAVVQTDKTAVTVTGQGPNQKPNPEAGGIFRSDDRGKTWKLRNSLCPRPFYYGQIRVDPSDENQIYVLGVPFHVSKNGGLKFNEGNAAKGTHADYHALWIDPRDSHRLILGCDGGLNLSFDRGVTWERLMNLPVAQFYAIGLDNRHPYHVYGGLQDNGTWTGPSRLMRRDAVTIADWTQLLGFDGYYCQVDTTEPNIVFCEGQYGILRRIDQRTGDSKDIKPRLTTKQSRTNVVPPPPANSPAYRFNWSSPIAVSAHTPKTVYFAGNHLFRSDDRGESWHVVSPDLTRGKPGPNDYAGHTIATFAESPRQKGLLFVGTDDGKLWRSTDGGQKWDDLSTSVPDVPQERWISRVECSPHDEKMVFVTIDRHRKDDDRPYVFRSRDQGKTWESIVGNLPTDGFVHVIRQDVRNPDLLFVGTDFGLFASLDAGKSWHKQSHLPTVPVHDLAIHRVERELVIATHGRGIYVEEIAPLQDWKADVAQQAAWLFDVLPAEAARRRTETKLGIKTYRAENPPGGASFFVSLKEAPAEPPVIAILDSKGKTVTEVKGKREAGLQRIRWDLNQPKTPPGGFQPVPAGTYTAVLRAGGQESRKTFAVRIVE
jgi:photosystem II stability/assembly factor-like uncharacterized protein